MSKNDQRVNYIPFAVLTVIRTFFITSFLLYFKFCVKCSAATLLALLEEGSSNSSVH